MGEDGVEGGGHAVAQDVKQKAGLGGGRASEDEGAADFAGGVVRAYGKLRRLKPVFFAAYGTAEAVPFPSDHGG